MGRRSYRTVAGRSTAPGRPRERRAGATRGVASLQHSAPGLAPSASVAGPQQRGADFAAPRCASTTSFHSDGGRLMRILIVVGSTLLLASCETRIAPSPPARPNGIAAATVSGAGFTFANFALGAAPGTVCPGSSGCTNGAAEPAIRADATGTFYVSSELGLSAGTLAWKSTDGGHGERSRVHVRQLRARRRAGHGVPRLLGLHQRRRGARDSRRCDRHLLCLLGARPVRRHPRLEVHGRRPR